MRIEVSGRKSVDIFFLLGLRVARVKRGGGAARLRGRSSRRRLRQEIFPPRWAHSIELRLNVDEPSMVAPVHGSSGSPENLPVGHSLVSVSPSVAPVSRPASR
jgi:hypothetical protein